jgi:ATP-dependent helicase Lhr and Lhr-like helicase
MNSSDALNLFLPPVARWFRSALGEPTPAQVHGWPSIAAGKNTLILAPTGSGKTLAAFLACLDSLWREQTLPAGVRVLYISPLKALNNDIYRNLQLPLEGVTNAALDMGLSLPALQVAVRTGDTPAAERQRLIRKPPHILITTPESLHLLLTSRARETLRSVTHCIVDEIHSLCPNKRGVFTALLLERLAALAPKGFVRIGLSATQRPLEEVAHFLGGSDDGRKPRPVTVIDCGLRKDLDLQVVMPVEQFGALPERTIWPSIYRLLSNLIRQHRSTIIFANNRRTVERITACLNAEEETVSGNLAVARAHHGSVSLEVRQQTEQALKDGRLPAVVSTASLELGIDMGAVDLVCQVESPGNIARALQRVGRAGHLVGQRSKGRLIPKMPGDLLEQAVLAREMIRGNVEPLRVPTNCLDILAQQIVAMVAMDDWQVNDLLRVVRRAYPFRDLTAQALDTVLEMLSGRYRFSPDEAAAPKQPALRPSQTLAALQPRISWDRIHQRLLALPGSQQLAVVAGGTIPDTGQYGVYTSTGVRIGELDEEFIYERRVGDTFLLGTTPWLLDRIEQNRVIVLPAQAAPAMVPFWRGEQAGRSLDLGRAIGRFLGELAPRLDEPSCLEWLERDCHLDAAAARNLRDYVRRQQARTGVVPTDRRIVVEASRDQLGDWQVFVLSPLGNRIHLGLRLALEHRLRQRLGYSPQIMHHNNGLLIRLTDSKEPILDVLEGITPDNVRQRIVEELSDSALFALRFRQNAARALLLPRLAAGKRSPLWLQRLRGRDLLQVARRHADFPIVAETYRECLQDHLDLGEVEQFLADVQSGAIEVATCRLEAASPFAEDLLFAFTAAFMYEFNGTDAEPTGTPAIDNALLDQLLGGGKERLIHPQAVAQVEGRLRGVGRLPRSATEMAEWLRRLGDLTPEELQGPMAGFVAELEQDGRAVQMELNGVPAPQVGNHDSGGTRSRRWILAEEADTYRRAFGLVQTAPEQQNQAAESILQRFLDTHALIGLDDILTRYPLQQKWAQHKLEQWANSGRAVVLEQVNAGETVQWSAPGNLEQVQRSTLALLRREVVTCPPQQFADFLARWQYAHPESRCSGSDGLKEVLARLEGLPLPAPVWEQAVLPARVTGYQPSWLDECLASGQWLWTSNGGESGAGAVCFLQRENLYPPPLSATQEALSEAAGLVLQCLRTRGALFVPDIARHTGLLPGPVRSALWDLVRRGVVTNDGFDPVRRGEQPTTAPPTPGSARNLTRGRLRAPTVPEARWSLVPWEQPDVARCALHQTKQLLRRYGVVARELASMDNRMLPWRVLHEVLRRLEMTGEVRRGYFVEGLSGAQFALPEAARLLQETGLAPTSTAPAVLLHSLDPANLFGSGAPLDIPLLDGGTRPLLRRPGNWLVFRAGHPILIVEQQGKRLTAIDSASQDDLAAAVACLPKILNSERQRRLRVEEWNGKPVSTTPGRELLETVGFVRDYQAMTLYAGWR